MTVCGIVVGDEFVHVKGEAMDFDPEELCTDCSQLQWRRDEPEQEVGIPDVEGMPQVKQERYGD
jgi:hypothetical protein